jgi:hypothetical protein
MRPEYADTWVVFVSCIWERVNAVRGCKCEGSRILFCYSHSGGWSSTGSTRHVGHLPRVVMVMVNLEQ